MALLLAFHHGFSDAIDFAKDFCIPYDMHTLADRYLLNTPGTAFLSSAGKKLYVGRREQLNAGERMAFRFFHIAYIEEHS